MPLQVWVEQLKRAYVSFSAGRTVSPLRQRLPLSPTHAGRVAIMPSYVGEADALGCKLVGYYPENIALGEPAVRGVVILLDPATGKPLALMDGVGVTDLRTGAIVAVALQTLATCPVPEITLFGTGALARATVKLLRATCGLEKLHIYSRSAERRAAFAQEMSSKHGVTVNVCNSPEEAASAASTIVCATAA